MDTIVKRRNYKNVFSLLLEIENTIGEYQLQVVIQDFILKEIASVHENPEAVSDLLSRFFNESHKWTPEKMLEFAQNNLAHASF